jgi:hypothetical protein
MLVFTFIEKAGKENVFYCDTDSLIVNEAGYHRLAKSLDDNEIGMLKLEKQSQSIVITNAKDYEFGDEKKTKGVPKNAVLIDKNAWLYLQFEGFYTWLHRGGSGAPYTHYRIKSRLSRYDKGIIQDNGIVIPVTLYQNSE